MNIISYAQNFEDVMLWRALKHIDNGFYIDVGANDPTLFSVTKAFYDKGWRGINIEPSDQWYERLALERPLDINLKVCAGSVEREGILFDIPNSGLSTLSESIAENFRSKGWDVEPSTVRMVPLNAICDEHIKTQIHFLKIDVEGAEADVLQGLDLTKWRPWIIVLEATVPGSREPNYANWEPLLLSGQYQFVYFDGLNRYYVADEHPELVDAFSLPPNVFDQFSADHSGAAYQAAETKRRLKSRLLQRDSELLKVQDSLLQINEALLQCQEELVRSKSELSRYQDELLLSKDELRRGKAELLREKDELSRYQDELVRSKDELVRSKDDVLQYQDDLLRGKDELVRGKVELLRDKDEFFRGKDELLRKHDELVLCQEELVSRQAELTRCQADLARYQAELVQSRDELGVYQNNLKACQSKYQNEQVLLAECRSFLRQQEMHSQHLEAALSSCEAVIAEYNRRPKSALQVIAKFFRRAIFTLRKPRTAALLMLSYLQKNPRRLRAVSRSLDLAPFIKRRLGRFVRTNIGILNSINMSSDGGPQRRVLNPTIYQIDSESGTALRDSASVGVVAEKKTAVLGNEFVDEAAELSYGASAIYLRLRQQKH